MILSALGLWRVPCVMAGASPPSFTITRINNYYHTPGHISISSVMVCFCLGAYVLLQWLSVVFLAPHPSLPCTLSLSSLHPFPLFLAPLPPLTYIPPLSPICCSCLLLAEFSHTNNDTIIIIIIVVAFVIIPAVVVIVAVVVAAAVVDNYGGCGCCCWWWCCCCCSCGYWGTLLLLLWLSSLPSLCPHHCLPASFPPSFLLQPSPFLVPRFLFIQTTPPYATPCRYQRLGECPYLKLVLCSACQDGRTTDQEWMAWLRACVFEFIHITHIAHSPGDVGRMPTTSNESVCG